MSELLREERSENAPYIHTQNRVDRTAHDGERQRGSDGYGSGLGYVRPAGFPLYQAGISAFEQGSREWDILGCRIRVSFASGTYRNTNTGGKK